MTQKSPTGSRKSHLAGGLLITLAALALTACSTANAGPSATTTGSPAPSGLSGTLNLGGATSQTAAQEAWRAGFQAANTGVTVNYDPTGSGTGRENFANGGYIVAGTDAAFGTDEAAGPFAACAADSPLIEIPAYISPIAVAFNLPGVTTLNLDAATIAAIFAGQITTWNDPAIASQNADATLPGTAITPVHRADKSGTTENFTDYLAKAAASAWTWKPSQEWPTDLTGEAANGTQGVRETLSSASGAIGYLDASQAGDLGTVKLKVGTAYVAFSADKAAVAVGRSPRETGRADGDIAIALDRTITDPQAYPLVLVSYLAACQHYAEPATADLVKAYLAYVISDAGQQAAAANAGSAPLSGEPELAAAANAAVASIA